MKARVNRDSPVPIYHQIAEAVRHRIATGELHPGNRLPSVRDAAVDLGVNLHTVRKAYADLARDGLVRVSGPNGTEVLRSKAPRVADDGSLTAFLKRTKATALQQYGLSSAQLADAFLRGAQRSSAQSLPVVHFIECSEMQCREHCDELKAEWRVDARPQVLGKQVVLPSGALLATYFHYNDIRQRWPRQLEQIRFVAIAPDPTLPGRIVRGRGSRAITILVCEFDEAKALNIAADLSVLFAEPRFRIEPRVVTDAGELIADVPGNQRVLLAPRVWAALSAAQRRAPRVFEVAYQIQSTELASLGEHFGWEPATPEAVSA